MATELPVSELSGDLRSPAVEQQRSKEVSGADSSFNWLLANWNAGTQRRVKYRNVNADLIGQPIIISVLGQSESNPIPGAGSTWTDKNK
jgi:hypothetical protein